MKSKSILLPLVGAALLSIAPAVGQTHTAQQSEPKPEKTPSHAVLHSMRAKRLHAKHMKSTATTTKKVKKQANVTTAKVTKRRVTSSRKIVRKVSSKTTKTKATSAKVMHRAKNAMKKHQVAKKSSTKS